MDRIDDFVTRFHAEEGLDALSKQGRGVTLGEKKRGRRAEIYAGAPIVDAYVRRFGNSTARLVRSC